MDTGGAAAPGRSWEQDDRLALVVARAVCGASPAEVGADAWASTRSGRDVANVLQAHGLLTLTDPAWSFLPLDDAGRRDLRALVRLQGITGLTRVQAAAALRDALVGRGVPAVFLKGIFLSQQIWGSAGARGAGDVDVLVPERDVQAAVRAIEDVGGVRRPQTADLRPRPMDRRMHHGLSFDYAGTEIDLHYRLDDIPSVMAAPFAELHARGTDVLVGGESFRTLGPADALLAIANHGGRDVWAKWGTLADFVALRRLLDLPAPELAERARALGMGYRLEVALALGRLLDPTLPEQSAWAEWIARRVVSAHAQGTANAPEDGSVSRVPGARLVLKVGSVARADTLRWSAWRVLWTGDAPGRDASDGAADVLRDAARAAAARLPVVGTLAGVAPTSSAAMMPEAYLAALVEGAARGVLDRAAFAPLDAHLRGDCLTAEDWRVLSLLAPVVARELPDHPFAGLLQGVRRQVRLRVATAEALVDAVGTALAPGGVPIVVLGDLAAARELAREPTDREVRISRVVVPATVSRRALRDALAGAAAATGAEVADEPANAIERFSVRVEAGSSLSTTFAFARARRAIWEGSAPGTGHERRPLPELVLFDSIARSSLGASAIQWFADAAAARTGSAGVDWELLYRIAVGCEWEPAVAEALSVLYERGWDVPRPRRAGVRPIGSVSESYRRRRLAGARSARQRLLLRASLAARLAASSGPRP